MYTFSNGTSVGTQAGSDSTNQSNAFPLYVGAYPDQFGTSPLSGFYFNGDIAEVLAYSNALAPFYRQKVEGYLAWKWGQQTSLPATHPFKNAAPTPTTVFTPSSFSSIQLWLDGADPLGTGTAPANGTSITTWANKAGVGSNATSVGTAPTYLSASNLSLARDIIQLATLHLRPTKVYLQSSMSQQALSYLVPLEMGGVTFRPQAAILAQTCSM
jgi:hypothetical protein